MNDAAVYAYGVSAIDQDEWSWSVQRKPAGVAVPWGNNPAIEQVADGCAYSFAEAIEEIGAALASRGVALKDASRLPF